MTDDVVCEVNATIGITDEHGDDDGISQTIKADHEYHRSMLDFIPHHFYFGAIAQKKLKRSREVSEPETADEDLEKVRLKEFKRARFDPSHIKTTTQLQRDLVEGEKLVTSAHKHKRKTKKKSTKSEQKGKNESSLRSTTESLEDLRGRLQARINAFQAKRKALGKDSTVEKKRMKRQLSKMKHKMNQKLAKQNKTKDGDVLTNGGGKISAPATPKNAIYNKEGKMVFSKFDFTDSGTSNKDDKPDSLSGKNYSKLLEKVQRQKQKIETLKETDVMAAQSLREKAAWQTALHKAEGVKVKDSVEMLKKSMKRKEKLKQKSSKQWEDRNEKLKEKMKDRQDKRHKNIKSRKQQKIKKKVDKAKKKGRILPGF